MSPGAAGVAAICRQKKKGNTLRGVSDQKVGRNVNTRKAWLFILVIVIAILAACIVQIHHLVPTLLHAN
jgi:hypothetical protein